MSSPRKSESITPAPTSMECLAASPLRGAILPYVSFGSSIATPVETRCLPHAGITTPSMDVMSYPADPSVALVGTVAVGWSFS